MEIELKLLIGAEDAALFPRHPLIAAFAIAAPRTRQLESHYFDTPDLLLREHGAALRVRRVGGRWIQTLKAGNQAASGLHERDEWECRVRGPGLDLRRLCAVPGLGHRWLDLLADPKVGDRLAPVFATKFRRTAWPLRFDDGSEAELALDRGAVECDGRRDPISEIELELKSGSARALFDFALEVEETIALRVSNASKAERGYMLLAPATMLIAKAEPVELDAGATVAAGMRAILGNCVAHIQANELGVVDSDEIESVHQMRVGIRRLRSALRLFDRVLACPEPLVAEVKWLADALGRARDWEVMASATLAKIEGIPDLARLNEAVRDEAARQRGTAVEAVMSRRYARMLLVLGQWLQGTHDIESIHAEADDALSGSLDAFAAATLKRLHRRLVRRAETVDRASAEALHEVRKFARRVRYASEFLKSYQRPDEVRPYVKLLTRVQDELGRRNDAAVAGRLLGELAAREESIRGSAMFASGFLACGAALEVDQLDERLRKLAQTRRPRQLHRR